MDVSRMTVQIRPRSQWEAIDMGVVVARKWFFRLWLTWLGTSLPFLAVIVTTCFFMPGSAAKWTVLLFWLFKPLYEPPLLLWVSRILFDEKLAIAEAIKEIRRQLSLRRIISVWFLRLSPLRSFTLPVFLLEGLSGKERKQRSALLSHGYETAVYLTLSCSALEVILTFSLVGTVYWLIPEQLRWIDFGDFIFLADTWLAIILYVFACSVLAPFYICCGFMLYLSRRVELEAWDLEIGFKQINKHLKERKNNYKSLLAGLLLCLALFQSAVNCPSLQAQSNLAPGKAKQVITEVLEQKEFGEKKTVTKWVPKEQEKKEVNSDWLEVLQPFFEFLFKTADKLAKFIAGGAKYLVWIVVGILIALILIRYSRIRKWLWRYLPESREPFSPPDELFGMDVRPESLPEDVGKECRQLLEQGQKREALSLLYRGALSFLVNKHHIRIYPSQTEKECSALVRNHRPQPEALFFSDLTSLWLTTAYGHREPGKQPCLELIDRWQEYYGKRL